MDLKKEKNKIDPNAERFEKIAFDLDALKFVGTNEKSEGYYKNSQYGVFHYVDSDDMEWKVRVDFKNAIVKNTVSTGFSYNADQDYLQLIISKDKDSKTLIQYYHLDKYKNVFISWKDLNRLINNDVEVWELVPGEL